MTNRVTTMPQYQMYLDRPIPKVTVAKLRRLEEQVEDAKVQLHGLAAAENRVRRAIDEVKYQIDRAEAIDDDLPPGSRNVANPAKAASLMQLREELATQLRLLERNEGAVARLNGWIVPVQQLKKRFEEWVVTLDPGEELTAFDGELKPKTTDLLRIRNEIRRAKADIKRTLHAPRSREELAAVVDAEVERLRKAGAPNFTGMIDGISDTLPWPSVTTTVRSLGLAKGGGSIESVGRLASTDVPATLAWLLPQAMRDALHAELAAQLGDEKGLSMDERRKELAALRTELLMLERVEEHVIETQWPETPRRADVDLRAFLGLADHVAVAQIDE